MTAAPAADPVAAYLAETAELIARRDELVARMTVAAVDAPTFNAAQDRLAERVPALAAALTAVLALPVQWKQFAVPGDAQDECADELREAIEAVLRKVGAQ